MAYNSGQYNSFLQGFMQGYGFIDDMYYRKRQEKRLDEDRAERSRYRQLQERRAQLGFEQRTKAFNLSLKDRLRRIEEENRVRARRDTIWERQDEDREFQLDQRAVAEEERLRNMSRREKAEEGARLLASGAPLDELRPYAEFNDAIMRMVVQEDQRARELGRQTDALESLQGLQPGNGLNQPGAGQAGLPDQQPPPGAEPPPGNLLAPSRGMEGLQSVDISEELMDPEMATSQVSGGGEALRRIGAVGRAATVGVANTVQRLRNEMTVESGASAADIGGNIYLPESFATLAEMEGMNEQQRMEALVRNEEIRTQIKNRASDPSIDPRDKLTEGSRELVAERRADMAATRRRWHDFQVVARGDDVPSHLQENEPLFQMAQEDPVAFAMQYFEDRATVKEEGDLDVASLDYFVRPFLGAAETELSRTVLESEMGSADQKAASRQLRALQATKEKMYKDYVAPKEAGIRENMPVGNQQLTQKLSAELNNPDRPPPPTSGPTQNQIRPALSTANRLSNNTVSRLSRKQLEHLVQLKDYGLLTASDVTYAAMNGHLPSEAKGKIEQLTAGKPVYWNDGKGNLTYMFTPPKTGGPGTIDRSKTPQLTLDAIEQIKVGVAMSMPEANQEFMNQLEVSLVEDETWLEELPYDLKDPIHQRKIGMMYADAHKLAKEEAFLPDALGRVERYFGDRPTAREILQSPEMAARIAADNGFDIDIPSQVMEGIEINRLRDTILRDPNPWPNIVVIAASQMNNEDLVEFIARFDIASGNPPNLGE